MMTLLNTTLKNMTEMHKKRLFVVTTALALCMGACMGSIVAGMVKVTVPDLYGLLCGDQVAPLVRQIVTNVRLPRIITGFLVGMNLSVAGALLQAILRNPIASPNVIGVNAGAGLAAVIIMTLFPGSVSLIPVAAFCGALGASFFIYALATKTTGTSSTVHIVLAGVAVSSLLSAVTAGLMTINSDVLDVTYSWLLGSLSGRSWLAVTTIAPYSAVGFALAFLISPKLNLFALGDEVAGSVGLRTNLYRMVTIMTASVLAGSAVSVAGTIGFVGLIAPHTARLFVGADHRYLVPLSALFGALLLVVSDTAARTIFQPLELSVGIITSVLGAPFFLVLLFQKGECHRA